MLYLISEGVSELEIIIAQKIKKENTGDKPISKNIQNLQFCLHNYYG